MVLLSTILDVDSLRAHIGNGLVTARPHKELPLVILNYTPECQYSRAWDDVTRKCRGLIYNQETSEVVARPFEKFGNWNESGYPIPPTGPALRMEKVDGSLGILYEGRIATRGSFHSEQADWATEFYAESDTRFTPAPGKTYLFEIIYPGNRIVVDYGARKGLVLLDVIDIETGYSDVDEFDSCLWPEKISRTKVGGFDSGQISEIPDGDEGFVFLWPEKNFRTKMKSAEYVELHKIVTGMSERAIWQGLMDGKSPEDIKRGLPEEFFPWVDEVSGRILVDADAIISKLQEDFDSIVGSLPSDFSRGQFAKLATREENPAPLFAMLDGKPIREVILRSLRPEGNRKMVHDD